MNGIELREQIKRFINESNHEWIIFGNKLHETNNFDSDDLDYLIKKINKHKPHSFGLANLSLRDEQVEQLAKNLHGNNTLKCLYLPFNRIGSTGAKALGALLATNPALTQLILFQNNIGNDGMISLANGLIANDTLLILEAFLNPFTTAITAVFEKILRINHELEKVLLYSPTSNIKESRILLSRLATNKLLHQNGREAQTRSSMELRRLSMFQPSSNNLRKNSLQAEKVDDSSNSPYLL